MAASPSTAYNPGEDFALTTRIEAYHQDVWCTNLYDRGAEVKTKEIGGHIDIAVYATLRDLERNSIPVQSSRNVLGYPHTARPSLQHGSRC